MSEPMPEWEKALWDPEYLKQTTEKDYATAVLNLSEHAAKKVEASDRDSYHQMLVSLFNSVTYYKVLLDELKKAEEARARWEAHKKETPSGNDQGSSDGNYLDPNRTSRLYGRN